MKQTIVFLLLFGGVSWVYAVGSQDTQYLPPSPHHNPPAVGVPPSAPLVPMVAPTAPTGGGTQPYCSSHTAPGYVVGLPNGGCDRPLNPPPVIKVPLKVIPYTGLNFWDWLVQLVWW